MNNNQEQPKLKRCARCGYNEHQKYLHEVIVGHVALPDEGLFIPLRFKEKIMKKGKLTENRKSMIICDVCAFDLFGALEEWFRVIDPDRPTNEEIDMA